MFLSEKDFKKAKQTNRQPSKIAGTFGVFVATEDATTSPTHLDVVVKAKAERELRQLHREQTVFVLRIQKWWRGRHAAVIYRKSIIHTVDKKHEDIKSVTKLLKTRGVTEFCPPIAVIMEMMSSMFHLDLYVDDDIKRLSTFVNLLLIPSLNQLEAEKNVISEITKLYPLCKKYTRLHKMSKLLLKGFSYHFTLKKDPLIFEPFIQCLLRLTGAHGQMHYKLKLSSILESSFTAARSILVKTPIGLFESLKVLVVTHGEALMKLTPGESYESKPNLTLKHLTSFNRPLIDKLFEICLNLVEADTTEINDRLSVFCREIMSAPFLTCLLSSSSIDRLVNWKLFGSVLAYFYKRLLDNSLALPPAPNEVVQGGQLLNGNISSLASCLPLVSEISLNDSTLIDYLKLVFVLQLKHPIPGVFLGQSSIMWTKMGASYTAAALPTALQSQLLCLFDPIFLNCLLLRVMDPVHSDLSMFAKDSDSREINAALASSGLEIAMQVISQEQEASVWFTSKWATKLLTGITKTVALPKSIILGATNSQEAILKPFAQTKCVEPLRTNNYHQLSITGDESQTQKEDNSIFELNVDLVSSLANMLSLLLSQAVVAPLHSAPWKALSSLAFASDALPKFWVALLSMNLSYSSITTEQLKFIDGALSSLKPAIVAGVPLKAAASSSTIPQQSTFLNYIYSAFGSSTTPTNLSMLNDKSSNCSAAESSHVTISQSSAPRDYSVGAKSSHHHIDNQSRLEYFASTFDKSAFVPCGIYSALTTVICLLRIHLIALDDSEMYSQNKPIPLHQIVRLVRICKQLLFRAIRMDPAALSDTAQAATSADDLTWNPVEQVLQSFSGASIRSFAAVLSDLYSRWARKPFSSMSLWLIDEIESSVIKQEIYNRTPFAVALLRHIPWSIGFHERLVICRQTLDKEKLSVQGPAFETFSLLQAQPQQQRSKGITVRIRRSRVIEDGMKAFDKVGSSIKDRMMVHYVDEFNNDEMGIDSGGLFKDFLTDLSTRIFNPNYGLFSATKDMTLYPNPSAIAIYGERDAEKTYAFLGRVLGKAIFEGITVQPQFSHFFLAFMHGRYNYLNLINDLASLDTELHRNLMFLKTYDGDIADLCLTFSVDDDALGARRTVELLPGGSNMSVTGRNKHRYINAVAKYYLHDRLKLAARAFFSGVRQVVSTDLLSMFCAPELQVVISGAMHGVSLSDMKAHTHYAGGYSSLDRTVVRFWSVVEDLSDKDKAALLKFVTSCERPPSLGFAALQPPFTIQRVECTDDSRLPTASTCFNILKLPTYSSQAVLKVKLLQSIQAGAGFDLS